MHETEAKPCLIRSGYDVHVLVAFGNVICRNATLHIACARTELIKPGRQVQQINRKLYDTRWYQHAIYSHLVPICNLVTDLQEAFSLSEVERKKTTVVASH